MAVIFGCTCVAGCSSARRDPARGFAANNPPSQGRADDVGGVRFVDRAPEAGLHYGWKIAGKRPCNLLQTIGNGCAFLDYNGDGNLDILLVGPRVALYRGDGAMRFTDVSHETGIDRLKGQFLGCATGDYDNDGWTDIYISGYRTGVLLHNEGGRALRDVTAEAGLKPQPWGTSAAFYDVDGDGLLDLYIGNYVRFGPETVPQLCSRGGHMTACGPLAYEPERGVLLRNLGHGRFRDVTREWGAEKVSGKALGVAFVPGERGEPVLAIANDEMPGDLLVWSGRSFTNRGETAGTGFSAAGKAYAGMGLDWGDYDNDGRLDLAVASFEDEAKLVFRNEGGDYFQEVSASLGVSEPSTPYVAFGEKWIDLDNDGWLDLVMANGHTSDNVADLDTLHTYRQRSLLFRNLEGKRMVEIGAQASPAIALPIVGRGLAVGDIDNDGRQDILLVDSEGAPVLLHNESRPTGHWLLVRLVGTRGNRDGYGAVVTAQGGGRTLTRHCHADGSYLSASDSRVHFGLASETRASIVVRWRNGRSESFGEMPVDHVVTLTEGAGKPTPAR